MTIQNVQIFGVRPFFLFFFSSDKAAVKQQLNGANENVVTRPLLRSVPSVWKNLVLTAVLSLKKGAYPESSHVLHYNIIILNKLSL